MYVFNIHLFSVWSGLSIEQGSQRNMNNIGNWISARIYCHLSCVCFVLSSLSSHRPEVKSCSHILPLVSWSINFSFFQLETCVMALLFMALQLFMAIFVTINIPLYPHYSSQCFKSLTHPETLFVQNS